MLSFNENRSIIIFLISSYSTACDNIDVSIRCIYTILLFIVSVYAIFPQEKRTRRKMQEIGSHSSAFSYRVNERKGEKWPFVRTEMRIDRPIFGWRKQISFWRRLGIGLMRQTRSVPSMNVEYRLRCHLWHIPLGPGRPYYIKMM